jgi:hypothetical protein
MASMKEHFDVRHEGFASPIKHTCERFCSMFPDTDVFFGSWGSFYNFEPMQGSFVVQLASSKHMLRESCRHVVDNLQTSTSALSFCVVASSMKSIVNVTDWLDANSARFLRQRTVLRAGKHHFLTGVQHRRVSKTDQPAQVVVGEVDSHIYWLQNDAGASKWPILPDLVAKLESDFQPPSASTNTTVDSEAQGKASAGKFVDEPNGASPDATLARKPVAEAAYNGKRAPISSVDPKKQSLSEDSSKGNEGHPAELDITHIANAGPMTQRSQVSNAPVEMKGRVGHTSDRLLANGAPIHATHIATVTAALANGMQEPDGEVFAWLGVLGLSKYTRHFAEHEIDMACLSLLTDEDLIDIGVSALGARKKMLRTIAELPRDSFSVLTPDYRPQREFPCVSIM